MKEQKENGWSIVLTPKRALLDIPIREIIEYKDLILLFIRRDFVTKYKQTVLGPIWYIVSPLISSFIYSFVFGRLAKLQTDGIPYVLFYYMGTMLWSFFTTCFTSASNIFVDNAGIFGKVYFPRLVVPISNVAGALIKLLMQALCIIGFYIYYVAMGTNCLPTIYILLFPFILLWIALLANGCGMVISSITTKYRDLRLLMEFAIGLFMYGTAVVYPISQIPENYKWLSYVNPMNSPLELSRIAFYGKGSVDLWMLTSSIGLTLFFFFFGLLIFNQNERNFIDVL